MNDQPNIDELILEGRHAFVENRMAEAIETFSRVLESDPKNETALKTRGSAYLRSGKAAEAAADFHRMVHITPQDARSHHLHGLALEKCGDDKRAMEALNTALDLDPDYGAAYMSRANLHAKMGNESEASEDSAMVTHITQRNIEMAANEGNVWRTNHMQVEGMLETELQR